MDIQSIMKQHGITQPELAKKMNVELSTVSRKVTGNPNTASLSALAEAIGCHRWEFFIDEIRAAGYDVVKAQEEEKTDETINDNQGQQSGGEASAEDATTTEQEGAAADAPSDAPSQQAEQVRAVRFTYKCPKCGERISVTIE